MTPQKNQPHRTNKSEPRDSFDGVIKRLEKELEDEQRKNVDLSTTIEKIKRQLEIIEKELQIVKESEKQERTQLEQSIVDKSTLERKISELENSKSCLLLENKNANIKIRNYEQQIERQKQSQSFGSIAKGIQGRIPDIETGRRAEITSNSQEHTIRSDDKEPGGLTSSNTPSISQISISSGSTLPISITINLDVTMLEKLQKLEQKIVNIDADRINLRESNNNTSDRLKKEQRARASLEKEISQTRIMLNHTESELHKKNLDYTNLENDLKEANKRFENQLKTNEELRDELVNKKSIIAHEWASQLVDVLRKLASLAEEDPEPIRGLKPQAVYEELKDWMGNAFGEKLRIIPTKNETKLDDLNRPVITLDAETQGLENLKRLYDWMPDKPFDSSDSDKQKATFRVLQRGWKVGDQVLLPAKLTLLTEEHQE